MGFMLDSEPTLPSRVAARAVKTYDEAKGKTFKGWVRHITKRAVWYEWRRRGRHPVQQLSEFQAEQLAAPELASEELPVSRTDWKLLCEYYLEKWPMDVVAREYGCSRLEAHRKVRAALSRLRSAMEDA